MKNNFTIHRSVLKFLLAFVIILVIIAVVGVIIFVGLQASGKNRLYQGSDSKRPDLSGVTLNIETESVGDGEDESQVATVLPIITEEDSDNWQEGDVRYQGVHYRYNSEMLTFLFLGVDKEGTVKDAKNGIDGGQSDAIFLLCINPKTKEVSLININRDTIADIDVYDKAGNYIRTAPGQITLQHGYGDGKALSCERSMKAVSRLLYNLPIHGYCAINMGAIPKINDAVGGVELVAIEDITWEGKVLIKEGQKVHLKGQMAVRYLRSRDCESFESAGRRAERQKQYLSAYAATATAAMKKDVTVLVSLYNTISKYMVTDITVDEVSYFSTKIGEYRFGEGNIYSLQGKTIMGEQFEEFHVDEKAMFELVLKIFYDTIDD